MTYFSEIYGKIPVDFTFLWDKTFVEAAVYKLFYTPKTLVIEPLLLRDSSDQVDQDIHLIQICFLHNMLIMKLSPKCGLLTCWSNSKDGISKTILAAFTSSTLRMLSS